MCVHVCRAGDVHKKAQYPQERLILGPLFVVYYNNIIMIQVFSLLGL